MREIPLTRGLVALVDDEDFEAVAALGRWYANPSCRTFYARKNFNRGGKFWSVRMHTFLTGWELVDHVNGNGLDNRRSNLRRASASQNAMNRRLRSDNASGFTGVYAHGRKWRATITPASGRIHLGVFATPQQAALAYDAAALEIFGEFANLNYPQGEPQ